ncbi:TPA: type II toxin-antitoxin system RelE/ParE family toxin [Yersinia enterocolitica]
MSRNYVLTDAAEADMRSIIRYTRKQWGDAQVRNYIKKLETGIIGLAAGDGAFKDMSEIWPRLRMAHCEHHYVFCLPRERELALVVAIFHERMDLMVRLAERLNA